MAAAPSAEAAPSVLDDPGAFRDPPRQVRPKFRWWWGNFALPSSLDTAAVTEELEAIGDAGFGGVEIGFTPSVWANDAQRAGLQAALAEARRRGLGVDMTLGANWPLQTPNTAKGSGLSEQELMYGRKDVSGTFDGAVPPAIGDDQPRGKLVAVTAARVVDRGPAVDQAGTPPAKSTVLDPDSLVDLTARVRSDRTLHWDAPPGDWILFAFWQREADEGVVDHLRADSARAALKYIDDNQLGPAAAQLTGVGGSFFEDSLELDVKELFWTDRFQAEFARRRGYDMTRFLPLMFVQGEHKYWVPETEPTPDFELPGGEGFRYRHDYYETETDLYVDEHLKEISRWAKGHGMKFRSQVAYGNSFDVTRSARELARDGGLVDDESLNAGDIRPFGIGSRDWHFAFDHYRSIVGGSHQGGSNVVGDELGAVFLDNLMMGLPDYRAMMDKAWAAGVTRPLIHGYQSQSAGASWPGDDHFLGIVTDSWNHRTFPQWAMWRPLADYWGRGALVLQQGAPRTDVAVYRDGFVTTAATIPGEAPETLDAQAGALPEGLRDPLKQAVAQKNPPRPHPFFDTEPLERTGFTIEYLDPVGVRDGETKGRGVLFADGPAYRALVVDEEWMPAATAQALDRASQAGLRVVFVGGLPRRADSARDAASEDAALRAAIARIRRRATTRLVAEQADVPDALLDLGVHPASEWSRSWRLYSQRRQIGDTDLYYLWNAADDPVRLTASFDARGAPQRLDLWTGEITDVAQWRQSGDRVRVPIALAPGETTVLAFRPRRDPRAHVVSTTADDTRARGDQVEVEGRPGSIVGVQFSDGSSQDVALPGDVPAARDVSDWSLHVDESGPEGTTPRELPVAALGDWRTKPGLNNASGTGTYTATVNLPASWTGADRGARLQLGRVEGAALASVNGRPVSPELSARRALDVTPFLHAGANTLDVVLTTTLKNKAVSVMPLTVQSRPGVGATPGTQAYGLFGPVSLVPYARGVADRPLLPASSRRCGSRRRFAIHACVPKRFRIRRARVRIGSAKERRVRARRTGRRVRVVVNLRGRPRGPARVRLRLTGPRGRTLTTIRRYRLCARRS